MNRLPDAAQLRERTKCGYVSLARATELSSNTAFRARWSWPLALTSSSRQPTSWASTRTSIIPRTGPWLLGRHAARVCGSLLASLPPTAYRDAIAITKIEDRSSTVYEHEDDRAGHHDEGVARVREGPRGRRGRGLHHELRASLYCQPARRQQDRVPRTEQTTSGSAASPPQLTTTVWCGLRDNSQAAPGSARLDAHHGAAHLDGLREHRPQGWTRGVSPSPPETVTYKRPASSRDFVTPPPPTLRLIAGKLSRLAPHYRNTENTTSTTPQGGRR